MKVLVVNDFFFGGGAEGVFRATLGMLKESIHKVDYFVGSKYLTHPKGALSYLYNKQIAKKLEEKLKSFQPDIVHIHNYYHYLYPSVFNVLEKYKRGNKIRIILTAHDYHLICPSSGMLTHKNGSVEPISIQNNSFRELFFKKIDHRGLKFNLIKKVHWFLSIKLINTLNQVDLIISPSFFLKEVFRKSGIKTPIEVVRNPFAVEGINQKVKKLLTKDKVKLLFIGRLSKEKGLLEFLKALNELKNKDITFDILGSGECLSEVKNYVTENEMRNVYIHGHKTGGELSQFLNNCNVLVLPSVWYENAPLSIIEGASFGNIILGSNLGGIKELSKLTKNYVLVSDWKKELPGAIERIKQMEANFVVYPEDFSEEKYKQKLIKLYSDLV